MKMEKGTKHQKGSGKSHVEQLLHLIPAVHHACILPASAFSG